MKRLNPIVDVDLAAVSDTQSFHATWSVALGFPDFYGANWSAWIDCMTSLDDPDAGMTSIHVAKGQVLVLQLKNVKSFKVRCPDLFEGLEECAAFVNWRRIECGLEPVLCLSYHG